MMRTWICYVMVVRFAAHHSIAPTGLPVTGGTIPAVEGPVDLLHHSQFGCNGLGRAMGGYGEPGRGVLSNNVPAGDHLLRFRPYSHRAQGSKDPFYTKAANAARNAATLRTILFKL